MPDGMRMLPYWGFNPLTRISVLPTERGEGLPEISKKSVSIPLRGLASFRQEDVDLAVEWSLKKLFQSPYED